MPEASSVSGTGITTALTRTLRVTVPPASRVGQARHLGLVAQRAAAAQSQGRVVLGQREARTLRAPAKEIGDATGQAAQALLAALL